MSTDAFNRAWDAALGEEAQAKLAERNRREDDLLASAATGGPFWGVGKPTVVPGDVAGLEPLPMRDIGPGEISAPFRYEPAGDVCHHRPPLEKYVRTTIEHRGFTFEPAVEWRDGDGFYEITEMLDRIATDPWRPNADPMRQAELIGLAIMCMWPGRAYFVEVWHGERRGFAQCVQPYGFPRNHSGEEMDSKSADRAGAALSDSANRTLDDMFAELRSEIVRLLPAGRQAHEMLARLEDARTTPAIQPPGSKYPLPTGASASFRDAVNAKEHAREALLAPPPTKAEADLFGSHEGAKVPPDVVQATEDLIAKTEQITRDAGAPLETACRLVMDLGYAPADCLIEHHAPTAHKLGEEHRSRDVLVVRGVPAFEVTTVQKLDGLTLTLTVVPRVLTWPDPAPSPEPKAEPESSDAAGVEAWRLLHTQ